MKQQDQIRTAAAENGRQAEPLYRAAASRRSTGRTQDVERLGPRRLAQMAGGGRLLTSPMTRATTKTIRKIKNSTCAMPAAVEATPPKPRRPAMTAITRKTRAQ